MEQKKWLIIKGHWPLFAALIEMKANVNNTAFSHIQNQFKSLQLQLDLKPRKINELLQTLGK